MRGSPPVLDESVVVELRSPVAGDVIAGEDAAYDEVRNLWNGAIDRYSASIVRPTSTGDVATAIGWFRSIAAVSSLHSEVSPNTKPSENYDQRG